MEEFVRRSIGARRRQDKGVAGVSRAYLLALRCLVGRRADTMVRLEARYKARLRGEMGAGEKREVTGVK